MRAIRILLYISVVIVFSVLGSGCKKYLNILPGDKITTANFPKSENDIKILVNGVYSALRETNIYLEGLFGFGILDGATPNGFNWGNTAIDLAGKGGLSSSSGQFVDFRWQRCYTIINRVNFVLDVIKGVDIPDANKAVYIGEMYFLRGLAYSLLVDAYGGVPIITAQLSSSDARQLTRASTEDTWGQVISDYNLAIGSLNYEPREIGKASKGAAMGLKMRAYLYQHKYADVIRLADSIIALGKYSLFPSYEGLFQLANENNSEVLFDVQYIRGENSQGSLVDQYCGTGTGSFTRGTRYVPTGDLVDAYERIDGTQIKYSQASIDLDNPYDGWDPRMRVTVVVPGSYFLGFRFPNYLYPGGAFNHPGNRLKQFSDRKYRIEPIEDLPPSGQSDLNYIVIRYADVLLSKAEALIETNTDLDKAIDLINMIRRGRDDVKLTPLPYGLSQGDARKKVRHERRVEFAMEGLYWSDIRRWDVGKDIYPLDIRDQNGALIETKFAGGYDEKYNLLPIPQGEIALNPNLQQNPGW